MINYYIAVDIGASSGRLIAGMIHDGKLELEEIHRFPNYFKNDGTYDFWDIDNLIQEIFIGLERAKKNGIEKATLGIDTWAVDYVLINRKGNKLRNPVSYRDKRTTHAIEQLTRKIPKQKIYEKTGIQFQNFNTLFQLFVEEEDLLKQTDKILLIPDYIGYCLTGKAVMEETNASTTQLLNMKTRSFDRELLEVIQVRENQFAPLVEPGTFLGTIKEDWYQKYDLPECRVITVATHDTASAVIGTPAIGENWVFISSGTWSLLGMELDRPIMSDLSFQENYTNEWGAFKKYRFLKNIMGLWMVQSVRKNYDDQYSYEEMAELAKEVKPFQQFIDVNDSRFINPNNMIQEIKNYCEETGQTIPKTVGEITSAIYHNLALYYAKEIEKLEKITNKEIDSINIVGGGSNIDYLNQITSSLSGKTVHAGPAEATAIGNLLIQMIASGEIKNIQEGRHLIRNSFSIKTYEPKNDQFNRVYEEYKAFLKKVDRKGIQID